VFGIDDPGIYIAYVMAFGCLVFALWYGIARWNEEDEENDSIHPENPEEK
jgi:hypothetical protein